MNNVKEKKKILILDDNEDDRYLCERYLDEHYQVQTVESYEEATTILMQNISCVLLDYSLPGKNGLQVLKEWQPLYPTCAFVMLTGQGNERIAVESIKSGAQDYVVKEEMSQNFLQKVVAKAIEKVALQQELTKVQQTILKRERIAALGEMVCGLAHDFNNALSPIQGLTDLLLDSNPSFLDDFERVKNYLTLIKKSAADACKIVYRMHNLYKPSQEKHQHLQLVNIINEIKILTQPRWKEQAFINGKSIHFSCEIEDVYISGNESEIRELLINLVFNAVDAIEKQGQIHVSCKKKNNKVVLQIKDNGRGMTPEVLERCYEPFYSTKDGRNSGLGLSMVYGIVARHNAKITVSSCKSKGTIFAIEFPLSQSIKKSQMEDVNKNKIETEKSKCLQILVVDDDELNLYVLQEILTACGHIVTTAESGDEALSKFSDSIDAVITDLSMPEMKGDTLAKKIKEKNSQMDIILLTGYGDIIKDISISPSIFTKILTKPVRARALIDFIEELHQTM